MKSQPGDQFRIWAANVLKEYMIKGFAMDDERLNGNAGGNYWKELFDRIRDIRSSEKVLLDAAVFLFLLKTGFNVKNGNLDLVNYPLLRNFFSKA